MVAKARTLLAAAVLGIAALLAPPAGPVAAVAQPAPPPPVPYSAPPPPTLGAPLPAPFPGPPSPPPPPAPFNRTDPGPSGWADGPSAEAGLFFDWEVDFVKPHLKDRLTGTVALPNGATDTFRTPAAPLDWTASPTFELGYRFPDSFGDLSASYRFLVAEGRGIATDAAGAQFNVRTRVDVNQFDFDYASDRFSPGPFWDLKWRIGARVADVYFDSRIDNGVFQQLASNNFVGAGPHFGLDAERRFALLPGLAAFGRIDGAVVVGQIHQHFHEGFDGTTFTGDATQRRTQSVPVLNLQAGFSYTPPQMEFVRFTAGYQFERWWNLGRLGGSVGELTDQGVFLRGELDY